jgi:nucleotide-binding universal stress UspA family protein
MRVEALSPEHAMPQVHKILVATDFSAHAERALDYAAELAAAYDAPLVLLHVYANPIMALPDGYVMMTVPNLADLVSGLHDGLRRVEARARQLGVREIETRLVEGVAWSEIIAAAKATGCDLIVMGTHGRGAITHLLLGSVAEKVVRKAECPVLTVHLPR